MAPEKSLREKLEAVIIGMEAERKPFEGDWQEIGRLCLPNKVQIGSQNNQSGMRRANLVSYDTAGTISRRRVANGMATGLTSSSRPWFKLGTRDPELKDFQPVKEWLAIVQADIENLFQHTNYYDTCKMQYGDLAPMGIGATLALEHSEYKAVWHHMPVGSYSISLDNGLRLTRLVRRTNPTVEQVYGMVSGDTSKISAQAKSAYDKGDRHLRVPCMHVIERNLQASGDYLSPDIKKPWRSLRWEIGQNDKNIMLSKSGYDSQPITAPRWETLGDQVYCDTSPGFEALPDLRELQLVARRASRAMDNLVKPAKAAPAGLSRTGFSLDPGTINYIDAQSADVIRSLVSEDPRILEAISVKQQSLTRRVDELFYADLFMAISEMEGVQPRNEQELSYRNEEKLTQLGPVVDRVTIEKLEVDIDRAYNILKNLGMLPPIPPDLEGKPLEIEFISMLAMAQKASSTTAIERAARFVGFVAGMFPDAGLKFDAEQAIDEYAAASGTSPTIIRTDEVVAQMKEQMQAEKQRQQALEMAPAMQQGADAARLLSETQVNDNGESMLQRVLGQ